MKVNIGAKYISGATNLGGSNCDWSKDTEVIIKHISGMFPTVDGVGDYTATIFDDYVKVGCQKISHAKVKELAEACEQYSK